MHNYPVYYTPYYEHILAFISEHGQKKEGYMTSIRIFVCHDVDTEEAQREAQVLNQLLNRLREAGVDVIVSPDRAADEGFLPFLYQELPTCQWFILFETPTAVQLHQVRMAFNTALKLVEHKHLRGILRFTVTPGEQQDLPPEWSTIPGFDATYDYPRALERLLLALSLSKSDVGAIMTAPLPPTQFSSTLLSAYDRPPPDPTGLAKLKRNLQNMGRDRRGRLMIALTILVIIALLASVLGFFALRKTPVAKKAPPNPPTVQVYGHVYFFSTGATGEENITGICDGVTVDLQQLRTPAPGTMYYAWLLPDRNNLNGPTLRIGSFTPDKGKAYFSYTSQNHTNLFATESRFLVTEESASNPPLLPTANTSMWRYYAQIPETPSPDDPNHFSDLDLLRHLLVNNPSMLLEKPPLQGGLGVWFFQNSRIILEWASTAYGAPTTPPNPALTHRSLIRILDVLDGVVYVHLDVPTGTPILADQYLTVKPLLSLDPSPMQQNPPGYIYEIELHLLALTIAPYAAKFQKTLAEKLNVALNQVQENLEQVRQDAKQLVQMTNAQLISSTGVPLLDDLLNHATTAFDGQFDPTTGSRQGGATWIFDHMQELAQLSVTNYQTLA